MKSIEQKLKSDARAFNIAPDNQLHKTIMQEIGNTHVDRSISDNQLFFLGKTLTWMVPASLALVVSLLLFINYPSDKITTSSDENPQAQSTTNISTRAPDIDLDKIVLNLENQFINPIKSEQQAIINDLNFLKNMVVL